MTDRKVQITKEKETLLITLLARALETKKPNPIIFDQQAVDMLESLEYDFEALTVPKQTAVTVCMRGAKFDRYTKEFLAKNPKARVLHLGCGLDSRYFRLSKPQVQWFDLDFPEVIKIKQEFFKEDQYYRLKGFNVTDPLWRQELLDSNQPILILAEGLFMYIPEDELRKLFHDFKEANIKGQIIFDAYSCLTARRVKNHPAIKKTGAVIHWGLDDPKELENWEASLKFQEEWYFSQSSDVEKLKGFFKVLFKFAGKFKTANRAHRIICYSLNQD